MIPVRDGETRLKRQYTILPAQVVRRACHCKAVIANPHDLSLRTHDPKLEVRPRWQCWRSKGGSSVEPVFSGWSPATIKQKKQFWRSRNAARARLVFAPRYSTPENRQRPEGAPIQASEAEQIAVGWRSHRRMLASFQSGGYPILRDSAAYRLPLPSDPDLPRWMDKYRTVYSSVSLEAGVSASTGREHRLSQLPQPPTQPIDIPVRRQTALNIWRR
ncbi:hypothetical protein BD324DRAFT_616237 [Kockovaella imperatae]|uniref:Uncharacterized protein n=1 Tax=Kockovaella imperatae TaxID=4999 RepID=A0A1Y1USD1_9TREE|nr:hypothetical protein BD324DRAFT_616237 [Kockovaella imperatae]ORX40095.1 hypothetical protein BD324DRAFT_616237 [Kockovaella imperatae]